MKNKIKTTLALLAAFCGLQLFAATDEFGSTPKHWYKFDGSISSIGSTGISISGSTYEKALDGMALKLDNGNSYGNTMDLGGNDFTITTVAKGQAGATRGIVWCHGSNNATKQGFALTIHNSDTVVIRRYGFSADAADILTYSVPGASTAYHFYALTFVESTKTLSLYVDGVFAKSCTEEKFVDYTEKRYQFRSRHGGSEGGDGMTVTSSAYIDDFRVYQSALTAAQISTISKTFSATPSLAPAAVWSGDFTATAKNGYTLNLNGNSLDNGVITINQSHGVLVDFASKTRPVTVLVKYAGLTLGSDQTLVSFYAGDTSAVKKDRIGFRLDSSNKGRGIWNDALYDNVEGTAFDDAKTSGKLAVVYNPSSTTGTYAYYVSGSTCASVYSASGLKGGNDYVQGICVGATREASISGAATNLKIAGIAVFDRVLTDVEMASYQFPAEASGKMTGSIRTIASWDKDFANGSEKSGYTVSYGDGATLNADGTISLAQQGTTGTRTDGVVVNFYDAAGVTAHPGNEMTVIVKYSGLQYSTDARTVLFSTKWGTSKDATEVVIVRTWDGNLAMGYGITAGGNWANEQLCSSATFPTAGLMMISCSGATGCNGTRVGFAPLQDDGTYGDFVDAGFKGNVKYTGAGNGFYGIKIGGTQGGISDMTRPGMKVEGVAVIKGVTSTMKTFKYLFPDECAVQYDWPGGAANLGTSASTLVSGVPLATITNAVFAARTSSGSMEWIDEMVVACQKKITLTDGAPTSMSLQYQNFDREHIKVTDAQVDAGASAVTIKKTGGHYYTHSGSFDKLGTDDTASGWTSSAAYNINSLSVYVPATKTATLTGTAASWSGIWGGAAPTADDLVLLNVTADTTLTIDSAEAAAKILKVSSKVGASLTIKYAAGTFGALKATQMDFTCAGGGVTFDISGAIDTSKVRCAVAGAPYVIDFLGGATSGFMPAVTLPTMAGYTFVSRFDANTGIKVVVTAEATVKFGSVNVNFMGNKSEQTSDNNAKVGSLTTEVGGYPVVGTSWNDLEGKNQTDTTVAKYVKSDGTVVSDAGIKLTASQVNNAYGSGAANNMLITGYMDDSQSPIVQISNIPFAKYRVILYRATDTASTTFSAAQIGTTSSDTKIYYGPTSGSETGGLTITGPTETVWGKSDWRTGYAEGVNYIVSDVLEGTPGSATAYIYSHKHAGRAGVAAIQIVEVDVVASVDGVGYSTLAAAEAAVQSGGTIKLLTDCSESLTTAKTFTLDLNGKTLGGTLNVEAEGVVTLNYNDGTLSSTVTGSGTIVYNGVIPTTVPTGITADAWTGTVWFENKTGIGALELDVWGNANSTIRLTGIQAYFNTEEHKATTVTFPGTLEVTNTDSTGAAKNYALDINNGWSNATVAFGALKGDGLIKDTTKSATQTFTFDDVSEFAGSITLSHVKFKFGTGDATLSSGSVVVTAAGSATVASGKTWTAPSGIKVNGKIGGAGTLASATTFGDGAEIDARTAQLTANGALAFGANTKVRVATAPTVETPVKVLSKSGSGDISTTVSVYVGDGTTAAEGTFKLFYGADGIYVTPYATHNLEMTADTTWADLISGKTFAAHDNVVVTAGGHKLTFTEKVTATYNLTINGDVTIAAWDALYVDGCWEETIATFVGGVSIPGTITSELKTGFNGAFTTTANSIKLRAQNKEVISINIAGGSGGGTTGEQSPDANKVTGTGFYGIAPTLGDSWNNIDGQFQGAAGTTRTLSINAPNAYDGKTTINRPTMSLSATGKNTWQCGSIDNPFLRGYLDDGEGVTVMVHGIPYTKYDVIVYATSDDASIKLAPVTINGTQYTFADGVTKPGSAVWGQGQYATPEVGKNALRINDCEGGTLTVNATRVYSPNGRATLCAVQVVCKGDVVVSSKYYGNVNGNATWTDGENDTNIEKLGQTWASSQLSTLTLTNKVASTLTFNPAEVLTGLTFKVVSAANTKMTIPYSSLEKLSFTYLDFSEAFGKVEIDMSSVTEGSERVILAGELTGPTNVTYTSTGDWGAYADATGIHMAPKANTSRNNPVTGEAKSFERSFFGSADASWNTLANWRTVSNGIWVPATKIPGVSGSSGDEYPKIMIDGDDSVQDTVTVNTLEGYNIQYAFLNGAQVTASTLTKMQGSGVTQFIWVDGTSSFKVNALGDNQNWGTVDLYVAAENGITFPAFNKGATLNYYFTNNASVKFTGAVTAGTHTIKQMDLAVGMTAKDYRHVEKKTLATFTAAGTTVTFVKDANIVIKKDNPDVDLNYIETVPTIQNEVGTYTIATESTGVYAYVVQYADHWDVVDPLTAVMPNETTDWSALTWTDKFGHAPYEIVGTHDYIVNASNVTATLNFAANVTTAKTITLKNDTADVLTLTKGAEVAAPTLTYSGIAGKAIVTWPVTALASSTDNVAYTGGAGTAENRVAIAHNGGTLNLEGGEYHLAKADSGTQTTVNMTDITADYVIPSASEYYAFTLGKAIYNLAGNTKISTPAFWLGQGDNNTSVFNMSGNATLTVTGATNEDGNHSSIMFGHWKADTTFTITGDAFFAATNAQVLVGKTGHAQTINLDGGTFVAKGIKVSGNASGVNTLNLGGGTLVLGDVGIDSYANNCTIAVNVTNDSTIASMAAMPITQTITVNTGKTLSLDATKGQITISKAMANSGTITVTGGTVLFKPGTFNGTITENGGTAKFGYYIDINDAGVFTVPEGKTAEQIVLYKGDGTTVTPTKTEGNKIYYECKMSDFAAWWKYEFNTNVNNDGTEGTALTLDGGGAFQSAPYLTNIVWKGEVATTNIGVRVPYRPYRSVSSWPTTATFVMYGKMPSEDNTILIGFGSQSEGDVKNAIFLAVGNASKGEVKLCKVYNKTTSTELCSMSVANATTTDHLYAFVLKVVDGNTVINTYLDGQLLQPYTFEGEITLGKGFQLGSIHGGVTGSGYTAPTEASAISVIDFLRVYQEELNSAAMAKYAQEYPYESPNGVFKRTLAGTDGTWIQDAQWSSNDTEQVSQPLANGVVQINASADTGLAVNLPADVTYESIAFGGNGKITLTNDTEKTAGIVKIQGRIGINTDTVLANDAFETIGSAISISDGKKLTLDCANVDVGTFWASTNIDLTGAVICSDFDEQVELKMPTVKPPRAADKRQDPQSLHIWVDITVPTDDIIGTVAADDTVTWTWAGETIQRSDIDFDQTEVAIKIVMESGINLTLDEQLAKADLITVNGGNLDIGTNRNMTVTGAGTIDAKLSDEEKASTTEVTLFDVSGVASLAYRNVTDKDGKTLDVIGSNGKIKVRPETTLEGLMFYMACPKPNYHDRDPNGRQSGWIDLVNYGPEAVDLADYKLVRCNMSKEFKVTEAQEAVSNLLSKTIAKGETFRVYTSEEYDTAEDYGGTGREVAWFKTVDGKVVKSASAAGSIMVVPTKVNPKKYPMVRLYKGTEATGFSVVDEVVIPCDIDDDAVVEFGVDANKRERWVVQDGVRTEYGPDVNSLYGVKKAKTDLQLLNAKGFVKAGEDFQVALPVNPFGTNGVALANNEIASVVLEYRTFDDSKEEDAMPTVELALAKGATDKSQGQLWTNAIPASVMVAGKLIQYRAKITDVGGKTFYAPRFLNKDVGYKWYGAVVQPNLISAPVKDSTDVCVEKLQTFLMFVCGSNKTEMDKDVTSQTLPYKARCAIFDAQTGIYYDNVRIDVRGQTSLNFLKKSHAFRFSKVAPLACTNPFDGEEIECRKTSFIAEYADPIFMRQALALRVMRESGVKAPFDYPVRVYLNGTFYQLAFHSNRFTDELVEDYYKLNAKTGYSYKNVGELLSSKWGSTGTEKKTPDDDNEKGDEAMAVLTAYADRIDDAHASARTSEAMKYFNIPAWVNYMAATKITQEADDVWTNLGIYINLYDEFYNPAGDDTMRPLAYDQNLSFGQWYKGDDPDRPIGIAVTNDLMKSHPFYGGDVVRYHFWDKEAGKEGTSTMNRWNRGMEVIFQNELFREALVRRVRTLADKFLGAPGTTKENTPIWQWAQAYATAMADDVSVDHDKWDYAHIGENPSHCSAIWIWPTGASAPTFEQGMNELWDNYITQRRIHLYNRHSATNTAFTIGYGQDKNAGIPVAQAATTNLAENGKIYVTDSTGKRNTEEGFSVANGIIVLRNANEAAVDISGWQLTGLAKIAFAEGTVIPAKKDDVNGKLVVVYDRVEARSTIESMTDPFIVNVDKETEYFTPGNTTVCLRDEKGTEVQGTTFYIVTTTDPETGKIVATATTSEPAGSSSINMPMEWMEKHGINTSLPPTLLTVEMNTPMEGGNGATPWESYALGLSPEKPDSKPVIAPVQTADEGNITFKLNNVTPVTGATVTYKVWMGDTPGAKETPSATEAAYNQQLAMPLPGSGVKYYTIEVKTVTKSVTQ